MLRQALLAKSLEQVDPVMHCDLCPSFKLVMNKGDIDVELYTVDGDMEWMLIGEEAQAGLRRAVNELRVFELTTGGLEKFKIRVARLLTREVHTGNLFKVPITKEETGNEGVL